MKGSVYKLENTDTDLDPLLERIGDASYVMVGEASHGTSEFYTWRAKITKRLIGKEKGFSFMAVEGDWPDCYRVNRYVNGVGNSGSSAYEVLHAFNRWPTWIWANREIVDLVEWLKYHNEQIRKEDKKAGFYGLDVYSLWESLEAVIEYLRNNYPDVRNMGVYPSDKCFEPYSRDVQEYAKATVFVPETCEHEVTDMLVVGRREAATAHEK